MITIQFTLLRLSNICQECERLGTFDKRDIISVKQLFAAHTRLDPPISHSTILSNLIEIAPRVNNLNESTSLVEMKNIAFTIHKLFLKCLIFHEFPLIVNEEEQLELVEIILPFGNINDSSTLFSAIEPIKNYTLEEIKQICSTAESLSQDLDDRYSKGFILKEIAQVPKEERGLFLDSVYPIIHNLPIRSLRRVILQKFREISHERRMLLGKYFPELIYGIFDKNEILNLWKSVSQLKTEDIETILKPFNRFCSKILDSKERLALINSLKKIPRDDFERILRNEKELSDGCTFFHRSYAIENLLQIEEKEIERLFPIMHQFFFQIKNEKFKVFILKLLVDLPEIDTADFCCFLENICREYHLWDFAEQVATALKPISPDERNEFLYFSLHYLPKFSYASEKCHFISIMSSLKQELRFSILEVGKTFSEATNSALFMGEILKALESLPLSEAKSITLLLGPFFNDRVSYIPSDLIKSLYKIPSIEREWICYLAFPFYRDLRSHFLSGEIITFIYSIPAHLRLPVCEKALANSSNCHQQEEKIALLNQAIQLLNPQKVTFSQP